MSFIRNPETKGILTLLLIIAVLGLAMAATTGKLEQWFNITWFSGPSITDKIAFISERNGTGEVFTMDPDGSRQKQLTEGADAVSRLAMSPTGNRVVFIGQKAKSTQVCVVGAKGGEVQLLTGSSATKSFACYSPDGKKLSFIAAGKVYIADLNGENLNPVLPSHDELHSAIVDRSKLPTYSRFVWTHDSRGLAGVTRDPNDNDMLMYLPELDGEAIPLVGVSTNKDSGEQTLIFVSKVGQQPSALMRLSSGERLRINSLAWAKQRAMMAVTLFVGKTAAVLVFDGEQGAMQPIIALHGQELGNICVNPDGNTVLVTIRSLDGKGDTGILKLDPSTEGPQMITKGEFEDLVFSPTGDRVLATMIKNKKRDVVMINPSTGEISKLTNDGKSYGAEWSPASEK